MRLQSQFRVDAPHGVDPSTAAVDASGIERTLSAVGQAIDVHDRTEDAIADKEAQGLEAEMLAAYEPERAKRASAYDGTVPGYAAQEMDSFDTASAEYRQMAVPARVQRQLTRRMDALRLKVSGDAIGWEAAQAGGQEGQRRAALEIAADSDIDTKLLPQVEAARRAVYDKWDGQSAGYATGVKAAVDAVWQPAVAALPEAQQARMQARYVAESNRLFGTALAKEREGQDGAMARSFTSAADTAANLTRANPDSYGAGLRLIEQASGALPGPMKAEAVNAGKAQLAIALVDGLASSGRIDEAGEKLAGFADLLKPEEYDRAQNMLRRSGERMTADDYAAQAAMESQVNAYVDGLITGKGQPRPDEGAVAATLGQEGLFKFRQAESISRDAAAAMGDFGVISVDEMNARIKAREAKVAAGGADYDPNVRIVANMVKARDAQIEMRSKDPAGWAATGDGTANDPATRIGNAWARVQSERDPQLRALAIDAYTNATLARQRLAGITTPALIPAGVAKGMVAAIQDAPDDKARGDALLGLSAEISQWGGARDVVMRDLTRAGLSREAAVAAGELADQVPLIRAYAVGGTEMKTWKPKQREELIGSVKSAMAKLDATLGPDAGSIELRTARYGVVSTAAAGLMAQGMSRGDAIRTASAAYVDDYRFVATWRMPAALAAQEVSGVRDLNQGASTSRMSGADAVSRGLYYLNADLEAHGSYRGAPLSDNHGEAEEKYRKIRAQGRWMTREDDSGLQLMVPNVLDGTWSVVEDKQGKALSYSWGELQARAKKGVR